MSFFSLDKFIYTSRSIYIRLTTNPIGRIMNLSTGVLGTTNFVPSNITAINGKTIHVSNLKLNI